MDVNANITTRSGSMVPSKRHKHVLLTSSQTPSTTPALAARANNTASQSRYSKAVGLTEPAVASIPKQTSVYVMPSKNRSAAPVIPAKTLQRLAHSSSHAVVHPLLPGFDSSAASTLHDTRQQLAVSQVYQGALLPNQAATSSNMSYGHQQHASNQQADTFRCTTTAAAAMPDVFTSREDLVAGKEVAAKMHALHAQAMQKAWQQQQQHSQPYIQPAANPRQAAAAAPFADASTHIRISPTLQHSGGMFAPLASSTERLNWAASVPLPSEPLSELQNPQRQQQQQQAQHRASETCKTADLSAETESLVAKLRALSSDRSANPAQGKPVNPLQQGFVYKPKAGKRSRTAITETPASTTSSAPTAQPIAGSTKHQRSLADAPVPAGAPFSRCSILKPAKHQEKGVKAVHPAEQPLHGTQSAYHIAAQLRPAAASSIDMSLQQTQTGNDHSSRQQSCPGNNHAMQSIHAPFAVHSATAKPACDAAEAPDLQGPPVSHQLGKVTPLKSSFTPRPSRFRLEAERCTPSQCCDSDSLQQVLFTSPIKEEGAADMADNMPMESSVTQTNGILLDNSKGGSQQEQAAEAAAQQNDVPMTTETAASSHDMNEAAACILETPSAAAQAIFRNMHFILDPAFLPDQQHR